MQLESTVHLGASVAERTAQLLQQFREVRQASETICEPLTPEDCLVQSMPDVSPTKWHLAHTTWFFETFVVAAVTAGYESPEPEYAVLFNSYYNAVGQQFDRPRRGILSRPSFGEVMAYRARIDRHLEEILSSAGPLPAEMLDIVEIGLHHEQQHQELMLMDIKHVFWSNPLRPVYRPQSPPAECTAAPLGWCPREEDLHWIGHEDSAFAYDNESPRHRTFVEGFDLAQRLVTCGEYLEFIEDDGYRRPELWLSDGWRTVNERQWTAPLYWQQEGDDWSLFTLAGMRPLQAAEPVCHVSYYEADAFARWAGARLPTEAAWETVAAELPVTGNFVEDQHLHPLPVAECDDPHTPLQMFGDVWEWTASPYTPYPGYRPAEGALGEYNGKFMSGQMVLRGGACVTPASHIRPTYRNFFCPDARWPFTGIRLAKDLG